MSEPTEIPGGDDPNEIPGGNPEDKKDKKAAVAYESYKKALDEKKAAQAKLKEFEDREKKRAEEEAKAKEDYKTLLETREKEAEELKTKLSTVESRLSNGVKLNAFISSLSGKVEQKYWGQINLDLIEMNPETGLPDEVSLKKAVNDFEQEYPEIIQKPSNSRMPNDAPRGGGTKLKYDDWMKLPYEEKRKRQADVVD